MAKPPPKKPDSLKAAFEPEAWEKFESLAKAAARERAYAQPSETPSKQRKGLRSAPLTRKTPLERKTPLTRRTK